MYKINCGITARQGIQIEFDDIKDFYAYDKRRENKNIEMEISGYIKSIDVRLLFFDEYDNGSYEWYVVGGKFLNYLEPLTWHPLEDYL